MIGPGIFRGVTYGAMDVAEGIMKAGGNIKGFGKSLTRGGAINGNWRAGLHSAATGLSATGLGLAAIFGSAAAGSAPRKKTLTRGFSVASSTVVADVIGGLAGGPIGQIVAQATIQPVLQAAIEKPLEAFASLHKNMTHINMGGDYEDTEVAYTMRQRAAQEMGNSLLNARQYLGREGAMFHQ